MSLSVLDRGSKGSSPVGRSPATCLLVSATAKLYDLDAKVKLDPAVTALIARMSEPTWKPKPKEPAEAKK